MRDLVEIAPDPVIVSDGDGRIVMASREAERTFGYEHGELIGQPVDILVPEPLRTAHAEHRAAYAAQPKIRPTSVRPDLAARRKDGSEIPVQISLSPVHTKTGIFVTSILRDISEQRRFEDRFRLQAVALDAAANGIVITDRDGIIQWVNPAFTALTGYARDEVVGQQPRLLKSGAHDPSFYATMWRTILSGRIWHGETTNRRRDGKLYTEEQMIAPVRDSHGEITHFVAIKQNVTERKEAEALRASLIRTMVHDLRNPLTVLRGTIEILQAEEGAYTPDMKAWARDTVDRAMRGMLELVDSILECERLKSGRIPLERSPVEVAGLIDHVLRLQAPLAEQKQQTLQADCPPGLPVVDADRRLMDRVMQNLVGNAIKFTPEGGTVRVTAARDAHGVVIAVADSGPGIPFELRGRLFEQFVTGKQQNSGSGLGLAFCRLAVEAHGGKVWVDSEPGGGAMFSIVLPFAPE